MKQDALPLQAGIPLNTLRTNSGTPLTTNEGEYITTNNPEDNMPTLDEYRPYRYDKDLVDVTTTVKADNDDIPTNWVNAHQSVFLDLPAGEYDLLLYFAWYLDDTDTGALFRAGINGFYSGDKILKEPKDSDEIFTESWSDVYIHTGGDLTVDFDFLKTLAGAGAEPLTVTRYLLTCKKVTD